MKNELPDLIQVLSIGPKKANTDCYINAFDYTDDGEKYYVKDFRIPRGSDLHRVMVTDRRYIVDRTKLVKQNGRLFILLDVHYAIKGEHKSLGSYDPENGAVFLFGDDDVLIEDKNAELIKEAEADGELITDYIRMVFDENSKYIGKMDLKR